MRAVSVSPRRARRHEPAVADQRDRAARRRGGDADRLALLPGRARGAAGRARQRRLRARRAAGHARRLRPPARAGSPSRRWRSGWASRPSSGSTASPARRSASCATTTTSSTWRGRAAGARATSRRCRCPGSVELGDEELELHPAEGHTADGMAAVRRAGAGSCACGDYLSDVEIPMVSEGGSLGDYRATLGPPGAAGGGGGDDRARPRLSADPRDGAAHPRRGRGLPGRAGARARSA